MPVLAAIATWFLSVFTTLGTFFAAYMTRRLAVAAAFTTVLVAMTVALWAAIKALLLTVAGSISDPVLVLGMMAVLPPNAPALLSAYVSARVTWWAYNFNKDLLSMYLGGV